jgi:uncharacterized membrane protein
MTFRQKSLTLYSISFISLILWICAIFLAPLLKSSSLTWSDFIYSVFSPVCHQISERCFYIIGYPLAVCSRCLGIYMGCLFGMILYPKVHGFSSTHIPKIRIFIFFTGPLALDTLGNFFSLWNTPSWIRFFIGFIWGVILPFYFISGLSETFLNKKNLVIPIKNKLE